MKYFSLILILISLGFTQNQNIDRAKELIANSQFEEAASLLKGVSQKRFRFEDGEKATVLLAESYLRLGEKKECKLVTTKFLEYYTKSPYRGRMEVVDAILKIEGACVYEGVEALLRILVYTKNPAARCRAKEVAIRTIAASLLTSVQLVPLSQKQPTDSSISSWIYLQLRPKNQNDYRYKAARYCYNNAINTAASESLIRTAQQGLESLKKAGAGTPTILL